MNTVRGVSGMVFLPARDYEWQLIGRHTIKVPLKGKISEALNSQSLSDGVKIAGEDDFSIFEDNVFLLWELVRVLFAHAKYPALKEDECFNVVALELVGDSVLVHGEIIKSLTE